MVQARIEIAPYDGKGDFHVWCLKMKAVLSQHKVMVALEEETKWSEDEKKRKSDIEVEAYNLIILSLGDSIIRKVCDCKTPLAMWKKLETLHANQIAPNLSYVKASMFAYKMNAARTIDENLDEFLKMSLMLRDTPHVLDETSLVMILMNAIPESYHVVKDAFQYTGDVPTYDRFCTALKTRELELKSQKSKSASGLFVKSNKSSFGNNKHKFKPKSKSDGNDNNSNDNSSKQGQSSQTKCYHCGKVGHLRKNCYKWLAKSKTNGNSETNLALTSDKASSSSEVLTVTSGDLNDEWVLDSGCSFHMCPNKNWFNDLAHTASENVYMGNNNVCKVMGMGSINLKLTNGKLVTLTKVRYVPGLRRNLISLGALDDSGCSYNAKNGVLAVCKNDRQVLTGNKTGSVYILDGSYHGGTKEACPAVCEDATVKWHLRLGHMSQKGLECLNKQGILAEKVTQLPFCEPCVLAKQHRLKFTIGVHSSKTILEYLHADLWGPESNETHGGNKYFLSIVDDYSRRVWTFLLKTKDEAFTKFKDWKLLEENQTGKKVKALRTDNGLEFCNAEFDNFCIDHGILRHKTVRLTPQQNGVAERMNRTLLDKLRCLLFTSGLPKSFWGEALYTATYLVNRSPNRMLEFKCPMEMWNGKKPDLHELKIFGCAAYAHTREGKLDPRSTKCIFLGYQRSMGTKGYRLWDMNARGIKILISRDVIFDENTFPYKNNMVTNSDSSPAPPSDRTLFDIDPPVNNEQPDQVENHVEQDEPQLEPGNDQNEHNDHNEQAENLDQVEEHELATQDVLADWQLARDRPRRVPRVPPRYSEADLVSTALIAAKEIKNEPDTYQEAIEGRDSEKWKTAMLDEMESHKTNQTWVLVKKPEHHKLVDCRWLFRIKDEDPPRYKARLVAKGFTQKEGIDYHEIFAPVVKFKTIRIMLALVAINDLELEQLDVKTAFLHGELDEQIYMKQPPGFVDKKYPEHACYLKKSLYGLKQSPRLWYKRFDSYVLQLGFVRSNYDPCFYFASVENCPVYMLLYVDDILLISKSVDKIKVLKSQLSSEFDMKDLGKAKKILGMVIDRDRSKCFLKLHQRPYLEKIVSKFSSLDCKPVQVPLAPHFILSKSQSPKSDVEFAKMENVPYANAIGSVMYAMISSRPDLSYAISLLSRFMSNPGHEHWLALKHVFAYIRSTLDVGLCYKRRQDDLKLIGYVDADFGGDRDTRKSTTALYFTLGACCISWKSQLQSIVTISSTESEYIALCDAVKEAMWLQGMLSEAKLFSGTAVIKCDSQSAICLSKNPVYHERSKHIDIKYHFVRDKIENGDVIVDKVGTEDNPADMGTKTVTNTKFKLCLRLLYVE
ncbi:unnamed protein product [Rhodiola kirilowii]